MRGILKLLLISIVIINMAIIIPNNTVKAADTVDKIVGEVTANPLDETSSNGIIFVANKILGFLQVISALLTVIMIAATGFRYITDTPTVKEEIKKSMVPIIAGVILVFFASSIAKFFVGMFAPTTKTSYYEGGGYWQVYEDDNSIYVHEHEYMVKPVTKTGKQKMDLLKIE